MRNQKTHHDELFGLAWQPNEQELSQKPYKAPVLGNCEECGAHIFSQGVISIVLSVVGIKIMFIQMHYLKGYYRIVVVFMALTFLPKKPNLPNLFWLVLRRWLSVLPQNIGIGQQMLHIKINTRTATMIKLRLIKLWSIIPMKSLEWLKKLELM